MNATSADEPTDAQPLRGKVLTTEHAAAYLDCSKSTLFRAARAGLIHRIRLLNGGVRWDVAELDAWVASCASQSAAHRVA
ncbi:MAG TPA: helix-turn-helix domain-containing protein [Rhodanobacteraceae bacterium]